MSTSKLRIRSKADPPRQHAEAPDRDAPVYGAWDPPVFSESDGEEEQKADQAVLYYEDDCLR
jgi:hypothetical protein